MTGSPSLWGTQTAALQTASDGLRLLPAGRTTDIPWLGIDKLPITLGQAYTLTAADVYISSAIGVNYGPVTVSGSGKNYVITLAQPINAADVITIVIDNPGISVFYHQLDVLPGDFNDDGVVNSQDLAGIRNEWLGVGGAKPTIFGDINGDGTVNVADYNAERLLIGTSLPSLSAALIAPGTGSQVGPAVVRIGTTGQSPRATASQARPRAEIQLSGRGRSVRTLTRGKPINQPLIARSNSQDAAV
jgi:Dockerin type I domain